MPEAVPLNVISLYFQLRAAILARKWGLCRQLVEKLDIAEGKKQ